MDQARKTAEALRDRCADAGTARNVSGAWSALVTTVALASGVTELLDVISARPTAPSPRALEMRHAALDTARAIRSGDLARAGTALERHWEIAQELGFGFAAAQLIVYTAISTGIATVTKVPEWHVPLQRVREFATKANAHWWLSVLGG
jgi:hypothetical protein